jgi:hypothetical protein
MSVKTQKAHMKALGNLLLRDLGYIFGDRESGPNGAKKEFLHKGGIFMRALAKDLGFTDYNVCVNKGGIAVSGEVYLYGMWGEGNGLFIELSQMSIKDACMMYRTIEDIDGKKNGRNQFLKIGVLLGCNYEALLRTFLAHRQQTPARDEAA